MERLARVAFWMALVGPAAVILHLVLRFGVNVPYWDEWEIASPLFRLANGTGLQWSELIGQHNEHRMIFPKLVMLLVALVTNWNVVANMVVSVALVALSLTVIVVLARPVFQHVGPIGRIWAALTLSATLFSLRQWENWLWGWQVQWFLAVLAAITAIALATWSLRSTRPWAYVAGASGAALVCQYSLASGVAAWASVALILVFHPLRRQILPCVLAAAAAATTFYLVGYVSPSHHPSPLAALKHPLELLIYLGNYFSGPFGKQAIYGLIVSAAFLGLAAVAVVRYRGKPELVLPWIAIGAFTGANALITGIGRVGFGAEQGLASRYVTIGLLLSVSLIPLGILCFRAWPTGRWPMVRRIAGITAASLLTILVGWNDTVAWAGFAGRSAQMADARRCLLLLDRVTDDCLQLVYPNPALLRFRMKQLEAFGWSGFPRSPLQPAGTLRLTDAAGTRLWRLRVEDGSVGWIGPAKLDADVLTVTGWARHPRGNLEATRRVLVVGNGTIVGQADVVGERPDVAAFFGDPSLSRSGWTVQTKGAQAMREFGPLQAYLVFGDDVLVTLEGYARIEVVP